MLCCVLLAVETKFLITKICIGVIDLLSNEMLPKFRNVITTRILAQCQAVLLVNRHKITCTSRIYGIVQGLQALSSTTVLGICALSKPVILYL